MELKNKAKKNNRQLKSPNGNCVLTNGLQRGLKFGLLSAYLPHRGEAENLVLHQQLKKEITGQGYDPIEVNVAYTFEYKALTERYSEWCLMVPAITFYALIKTAARYHQVSVLFNDYDCFNLVKSETGLTLASFGLHAGKARFTDTDLRQALQQYLVSRFGGPIQPRIEFLKYKKPAGQKVKTSILTNKTIIKWQHYDLAI